MFQKIKTHILCSESFARLSLRLRCGLEKYGCIRQVEDDNTLRRKRHSITKTTETHLEYAILFAFSLKQ
jgi:hypothetical protein